MKAILIQADRSLCWTDVPDPQIKPNEVLVEVYAAALNRADLLQRAGQYPPPPGCPPWMGLEIAGTIVQMGAKAAQSARCHVGDRVCALLGGGGYAQYVAVRYDMVMPVPNGCSMEEAAAIPEAFATAYLNLVLEGNSQPGDTLLVHAGASGLASVIIPMAKAMGMRVITTVRSKEDQQAIAHLGADIVVNTTEQEIVSVLRTEQEAGMGVNVAIDCLGGPHMGECLRYLNYGARWIMIATLAGDLTTVDLKTVYMRNIRIIGSTLRSKSPEEKAQILSLLVQNLWRSIESGQLRPTIYRILPIEQAEQAHDILQRGENVGKVVLKVKE